MLSLPQSLGIGQVKNWTQKYSSYIMKECSAIQVDLHYLQVQHLQIWKSMDANLSRAHLDPLNSISTGQVQKLFCDCSRPLDGCFSTHTKCHFQFSVKTAFFAKMVILKPTDPLGSRTWPLQASEKPLCSTLLPSQDGSLVNIMRGSYW